MKCDFCLNEFKAHDNMQLSCGKCEKSKEHLFDYFSIYAGRELDPRWDEEAYSSIDEKAEYRQQMREFFFKNLSNQLISDIDTFAYDYNNFGAPAGEYPVLSKLVQDFNNSF